MSWPAVLAIARSELRRRWRSMVALGVLAGVCGALITGSIAVTRRTNTAHDRLAAATQLDDARVLIASDVVTPREIAGLPGVRSVWSTRQVIGQILDSPGVAYASVTSGPAHPDDLFTPVIVKGRQPREDADDEVVLPEVFTDEVGLHVGDTMRLKLLTPLEVTQFDTGFGQPDGPLVTLRVVGVSRADREWIGNGFGPILATTAFYRAHRESQIGHNVLVRLDGGAAGVPQFQRALEPLAQRPPTDDVGREFGTLEATYPTSEKQPAVSAARHTLGGGLLVFIAVAVLGSLLAVVQGLGRHHSLGAADQRIEAALGLTRAERVAARLLPALVGAGVATVLAFAGGLAAAGLEPLGALGGFEPAPGWRPDWLVLLFSCLATGLVFLVVTVVTAARVVRQEAGSHRPDVGHARGPGLFGRRAPTAAGLSFALRGGRGSASVPVRTTMVAAVVGVLGVVAVATFGASLKRLESEPERYGWTADFAVVDFRPATQRQLLADDRVSDVSVVHDVTARVDGTPIDIISLTRPKGDLPLTVVEGRMPTRKWQIALGSRTAARLSVGVGDTVAFGAGDGPKLGRVVGLVVNPDINDIGIGNSSVVTGSTLRSIGGVTPFKTALVRAAPGVDVDRLYNQLASDLEMLRAGPPQDVDNLLDLGRLPVLLATFLALVSAGVLAHSMVVTIRRRGGDLAVLRAIGFTPRQVAGSLVTAATTAAVIGLLVGVPLGLAIGRVVWFEVASTIGLAGDVAVPVGMLLLLLPAVVVSAIIVALLPAWQGARQRPATALHTE